MGPRTLQAVRTYMVWRRRGMDALRLSFALQHTSIKWRSASSMLMSTPDSYDAEWAVKVK
jgi:hypothetical protein